MNYSCNDVVKLRGVMPFIPEPMKYFFDDVTGATQDLYVVPANTFFLITHINVDINIIIGGVVYIYIKTSGGTPIYYPFYSYSTIVKNETYPITPYYPFEVLATYHVGIYASVGSSISVSMSGFERTIII